MTDANDPPAKRHIEQLQNTDPDQPVREAVREALEKSEVYVCPECGNSAYQRPPYCSECRTPGKDFDRRTGMFE